jgi:hypothetical protein
MSEVSIITFDNWRVVVVDAVEGLVVLDVTAHSEAEAKGRGRTAAETHLNCKDVRNVIAAPHTALPPAWINKRVNALVH